MSSTSAQSSGSTPHAIAREEGGVLVMVAIVLPVMVVFVAFVIDVGNWFAHRRHLQTQADAAAFAGALEWGKCFGDTAVANAAIDAAARRYAGSGDGSYNQQLGGTSVDEIHFALNKTQHEPQPGNPGPTDTTVDVREPCEAGMVDVKMTETDLPVFIDVLPFDLVDYINTHARVSIFQRERFSGGLPFGVPDPNPKAGRVIFVDEANLDANGKPTVLGSAPLVKQDDPENGLAIWDNSADPFELPVNSGHIGVRVAFSGASSTTCGDPLVECYPVDPPDPNGLLHVRGYSTTANGAQPNQPVAESVQLTTGTGGCSDPYFVNSASSCGIGVSAQVDFGSFASCTELISGVGPRLFARRAGSNTDHPLTCQSVTGSTSVWTTSGFPIPVNPGEGPVNIELHWEETKGTVGQATCSNRGNNPCKGSFGPVQRTFSATDARTGLVRMAQLWENGSPGANSLELCPTAAPCHAVVARIGTDLNLENASSVDDPLVTLRFGAGSGSQNQALDCDPAVSNFRDEIALGCAPEYERNHGTACPATNGDLWALPQPWDCVALEPGDKTGQIAQGMNLRVHGDESPSECVAPNNWEANFPDFTGDPRAVDLFLTPYGAFTGSGSGTVPVTGFAKFYITGWHNSDQICPGDDTYAADDPAPQKSVVGHFISYLESVNDGTAGDSPCDPSQLGSCVPVMTQ
jgi:Putative Flp pilus-assembly TadE/G-like